MCLRKYWIIEMMKCSKGSKEHTKYRYFARPHTQTRHDTTRQTDRQTDK